MKRIFNFSIIALLAVVVLASCSKNRDYYQNNDYEIATVYDYADGTPYSMVYYNKDGTYAIIESLDNDTRLWPDYDDRLEGVFVEKRQSRVYNRTFGANINIYVVENVPTKAEAYDALDYYDAQYAAGVSKDKIISKSNATSVAPRSRTDIKR